MRWPRQKKPVKLLSRLEQLGLLTSLYEAGLLSSAEVCPPPLHRAAHGRARIAPLPRPRFWSQEAGVFSKLEAAGAFSTAEKLLPLGDAPPACHRTD